MKKTINNFKFIVWYVIRKLGLGFLVLRFYPKSILKNDGWFKSFNKNKPIDKEGNPLPWYTYSAIRFLEIKLDTTMRVFEYGCGYSTAWYSKRVESITSVDDNPIWAERTKNLVQSANIICHQNITNYINEIYNHAKFDVIVIDGIERKNCLLPAIECLKPNGVIIWDNSDRTDFKNNYSILQKEKFKELPFYGMTPSTFVFSWTSILYRENNIFHI